MLDNVKLLLEQLEETSQVKQFDEGNRGREVHVEGRASAAPVGRQA